MYLYGYLRADQEAVLEVCELCKRDRLSSYFLKDCASNDGAFRVNLKVMCIFAFANTEMKNQTLMNLQEPCDLVHS